MIKLEITLLLNNQTVINDIGWAVNYIFSFYTEEQKAKFAVDMADAVAANIVVPHETDEGLNIYANAGVSPLKIDTTANSIVISYLLNDPTAFCARFVNDWSTLDANNLEPIKSYFVQNPDQGSYSFKLLTLNGDDVTSAYYQTGHISRLFP